MRHINRRRQFQHPPEVIVNDFPPGMHRNCIAYGIFNVLFMLKSKVLESSLRLLKNPSSIQKCFLGNFQNTEFQSICKERLFG